ncbi:endonuclease domain-containing protein [Aestuariivirga sp.]|uniref:endonuclease domain-containing protein n=1 Tax=Aestuariivirga sp. TaxID=2650926 RepID=UPI003BAB58A3
MALLDDRQREHARRLRRHDTASEQRLWAALRDRRLHGLKFVRQLPVGSYVADFACREHRLIIEVDGATHATEEEAAYDAERTLCLHSKGWRVLRVWNEDVVRRLDAVLDSILHVIVSKGG